MEENRLTKERKRTLVRFNLRDIGLVFLVASLALGYYHSSYFSGPSQTGRELDVAVFGEGYFQIIDRKSATISYTRNGRLSIDSDGQLCVNVGNDDWFIEPSICIPVDSTSIHIDKNGLVAADSPYNSEELTVGQIYLASFMNEDGLKEVVPGVYRQTNRSGIATAMNPGTPGFGFLQQGWLEGGASLPNFSAIAPFCITLVVAGYLLFEFRKLRRQFDELMERQQAE